METESLPLLVLSLSLLLSVGGCGDDDGGTPEDGGSTPEDGGGADAGPRTFTGPECENVNQWHCLMPWPSSRYLAEDSSTATGYRIDIPEEAMPVNNEGAVVDPEIFARFDGFSPMTSMVTFFPGELDVSNLPDEHNIPLSLEDDSPTVLLDAETGERVGHFSERDGWRNVRRAVLYIRPAIRLKENHRYIVAIRDLSYADGTPVEPSEYFRALRDDDGGDEARRDLFEDIFSELESAGVQRDTLIEAWDFHTATGESAWGDLISMRDTALEMVGETGIGCTVESVEDDVGDHLWRRVEGTFTTPLFMDSEAPGSRIVRDDDGTPVAGTTAEIPFKMHIPYSVRDSVEGGGDPGRLLIYGHGLFGSRNEIDTGWLREWQDEVAVITLATDWQGMSGDDVLTASEALSDLTRFPQVAERLLQGLINFVVMTRSFIGVCSELDDVMVGGSKLIDTEERYYLGISQGGIFGATLAGISTDIERFTMGVGGISYPIMIKRSSNFGPYSTILDAWYRNVVDSDLMMVMAASLWDLSDPATYAPHIVSDPLPGTPAKRVLYRTAWYDAQVPNISSDIAARTMGIPLLVPTVRDVWNIEETEGPADSAYVQYKIDGVEAWEAGTRSPPGGNPGHEGVRRNDAAQAQLDAFMAPDGVITNTCDGPCDPQ